MQVADEELWNSFRAEVYAKSVLAGTTQMFCDNNQFMYSLKQSEFNVSDDIYSIDTSADIEVKIGETLTISENENIVFTCPNLIREQQYSTYVKRFYNLKNDVAANEDYQLQDGEWIAFFWTEDEAEDAPYVYCMYDNSDASPCNIICPTFNIGKNAQEEAKTGTAKFLYDKNIFINNIEPGEHSCKGKNVTAVRTLTGETESITFSEYIKGFSGSLYALTGSNQIETKEINKVQVNEPKKGNRSIFWILNGIETDDNNNRYFQLFHTDDETENDAGEKRYVYTLKAGEYFMYANASKTSLTILGQGTRLETSVGPGGTNSWRCEVVSYEDLLSYGIPYLTENNYWYTLPSTTDVFATEMQFYQLGPGTKLKVGVKSDNNLTKSVIIGRDTITFKDENGEQIDNLSLADFTIAYAGEDATEDTYLPDKNTKELAWQGYSILNINCGKNTIQYLKDYHKVQLYGRKREDGCIVEASQCCLVASDDVDVTGGSNISVQKLNFNTGELTPVSFATFQFGEGDNAIDGNVAYITNELTKSVVVAGEQQIDIPFQLPIGDYILNIHNSSDFESLEIEVSSDINPDAVVLTSIVDEDRAYTREGTHCLKMSIEDDVPHTMTIRGRVIESPISIQLDSPYRYVLEDYIGENDTLYINVLSKLSTLDNELFDYTYQVQDEDLVANPLSAQEFVNPSHIYNKYTICMWDMQDTISITNKIK